MTTLLYINTTKNILPYKILKHSKLSPLACIKDLIVPATFQPFTSFLLHYASSIPFSLKIYPKYLNSDTCSNCLPTNMISHHRLFPPHHHNLIHICFNFQILTFTQPANHFYQSTQNFSWLSTKPKHQHTMSKVLLILFHSPSD